MSRYISNKGSAMVEIVIAASIFLVVVLSLVGVFNLALKSALANVAKIQASFLEEEGLEAILTLRDESWTANIGSKTSGTNYYLSFNGTKWILNTTNTPVVGVFERSIIFSDVYRDSSTQNIVTVGGVLDPNTKKVVSTVSWRTSDGATITRSLSTYLTNLFSN